MESPFKVKPLEITRDVPIAVGIVRDSCDTLILGLISILRSVRVRADPTPWEGGEGGSISTRLDAGRALKARLELVPQKDGGTRITLHASGTVLILGRREILKAVAQHIDELTEIS